MPEIIDLPPIEPSDVTNDDLLVIYDVGAAGQKVRKVTRGSLMKDVAFTGSAADVSFGLVEAEEVQTPSATVDNLQVSTGLEMGATLRWCSRGSASARGARATGRSENPSGAPQPRCATH